MPTKIIREPAHIESLARMLAGRKLPVTVTWAQGASLSDAQRRLSFRWYADISRQLGDRTPAEARAECKVVHGAPILCEDGGAFAEIWTQLRMAMQHDKILRFVEVTELPITSIMTVKQMTAYLDAVQRTYSAQGVRLTDPEALKYESEFA